MIRPSQLRDSMMNKPTQGFVDSVSPKQLHGFDSSLGTTLTTPLGRPVPGAFPRYPHNGALQYNGTYFSYRLCGQDKDGGELPSAWSPSMVYRGSSSSSSNNSRSPMVPPAITEGSITSPTVYRQDRGSPHRACHGSPLTAAQELAAKRRHAAAVYDLDRSQGKCSSPSVVTPSAVVRRPALAGANLSPQADSPLGLAIPKPLYGHNACCLDSHCTAGHSYSSAALGLPRTPTNIYEEEWLMGYGAMPLGPPRKDLDMLLEQRGLHAEPGAERVSGKEVATEEFCDLDTFPNRRVPVYGDVGHSNYACSPTSSAPFIGVPPETCQRLPFPSREYPSLPPSHPHVYDPAALTQYGAPRKVFSEYPHTERYMEIPQRSRVYYPPHDHIEAEKSPICAAREKYSDGTPSPSTGRQVTPRSPAQYPLPQHIPPIFASSPVHCPTRLPRHSFSPRSFDHLPYRPYPLHLNGGHPRTTAIRPPLHPLPSRHSEKPLDYSLHRGQLGSSPNQFPMSHSLLSGVMPLTRTPEHSSPKLDHAGSVKMPPSYYMGAPQFPVNMSGKSSAIDKELPDTSDLRAHCGESLVKANGKRQQKDTKDKTSNGGGVEDDVYEVEVTTKKPKMDPAQEASALPQSPASPPMPVINQVFSLAPYKLYLEAAGVLPPVKTCKSADDAQPPPGKPEQDPEISEEDTKCEGSDSHNLHLAKVGKKSTNVMVKMEKGDPPKKEDIEENSPCHKKVVKSESCDAVLGGLKGEHKCPHKTDMKANSSSSILTEAAMPKCKDEVTSNHNTETTLSDNKDTKDSEPLVKPAVNLSTASSALAPKPMPSLVNPVRVDLQNIPPQCLKLTTYNIVLPEVLRTSVRPVRPSPVLNPLPLPAATQSPAEPAVPDVSLLRQARHQFMEMHQSLCRLLYNFATQTPPEELRDWLFKMELGNKTSYPPDKHQRVASLVGSRAKEMWARDSERSLALQKVLSKLKGYETQGECPFPHVMRAGGIFIPMLVLKEGLFPQVHDTFIDQVLQEHRVEFRPTTLSEEKHLTQLQKRACSSKLRRLLSLRRLPDIYTDVLNLFFYTSVCKVLDLVPDVPIKTEPEDLSGEMGALGNSDHSSCLEESPPDSIKSLQDPERLSFTVKQEPEERDIDVPSGSISWVHSSPQREAGQEMLEEELENMEEPRRWTIVNSLAGGEVEVAWELCLGLSSTGSKERLNIKLEVVPEEQEGQQQKEEEEVEEKEVEQIVGEEVEWPSWAGPVSTDDTCSEDSDAETGETESIYTQFYNSSSSSPSSNNTQGGDRSRSGVILKLRKILSSGGACGSQTLYQAVSDLTDPVVEGRGDLQAFQEEHCWDRDRWRKGDWDKQQKRGRRDKDHKRGQDESGDREQRKRRRRRRREQERRRKRKELSRSRRREKRERRRERLLRECALTATSPTQTSQDHSLCPALPKIRYCPYLSTCHRSDRRRRWVLRSAVQSARQAMQSVTFPDLVGKRIRHLYEEKDKSEVWYCGVVLRVHEPHPNPLKTVFEVRYDSEPEWRYYLELLVDYQKGWLKVENF